MALLAWVAARPLLDLPFETDAPVLRAAFAAVDVFGDWNHPFLPYLLERPVTWVSLEPRALRLVPLGFLLLEAALVALAATRQGLAAGVFAGAWFACEIRRRHGLVDLGDWDVAGAFLMSWVLLLDRLGERRGVWIALAGLLAAGVFSSWLMIVPASVLVGCLAIEAARKRLPLPGVVLVGVVGLVVAVLALRVFWAGAMSKEPGHAQAIFDEMARESPTGRTAWMIGPLVIGLGYALVRWANVGDRFTALTLIAVPAAVALAFRTSHVNGGYYAGLVTPLACAAAGAGCGRLLGLARTKLIGDDPSGTVRAVGNVAAVAAAIMLGAATIDLGAPPTGGGMGDVSLFLKSIANDPLPIRTNSAALPRLLGYERARRGLGPIGDVLARTEGVALEGPADLVRRVEPIPEDGCEAALAAPGYVALFVRMSPAPSEACLAQLAARCRVLDENGGRDLTVRIARCD